MKILDLPTSLIEVPKGQKWIVDMIQNILIEVMESISEQEHLTIRKRQREGIEAARKKGKHLGRPRCQIAEEMDKIYALWKSGKITAKKAMELLHMSSSTFYRKMQEYGKVNDIKEH